MTSGSVPSLKGSPEKARAVSNRIASRSAIDSRRITTRRRSRSPKSGSYWLTSAVTGRSEQREPRSGALRSSAPARFLGRGYQWSTTTRPALELVNREASAHVCGLADSVGREPSLPGARDIGSIVVEIQDLGGRETQAGGQAAERLRVRLAPAELGGKDCAGAEDVRDGGKHLCNVPLQQQRIVGEHPNWMVRAELSRKREHG